MADTAGKQRKVVLVVDDEVALLEALRIALEPRGFDVLAASNPFMAVRLAAMSEPDVVVMDIDMPGMDGVEAAKHLKNIEQTRAIPVIAFTGRPLGSLDSYGSCDFRRIVEKAGGLEPLEREIAAVVGEDAPATSNS
jgi:CheY-like chemotaxis protein